MGIELANNNSAYFEAHRHHGKYATNYFRSLKFFVCQIDVHIM